MKYLLLLPLFFVMNVQAQSQSSTLSEACKNPGFSCGECETSLQDDLNSLLNKVSGGNFKQGGHWGDGKDVNANPSDIPMSSEANLDQTLGDIIALMKKHNPDGDNKLNFVVIGESESLQASSIKDGKLHPRVMLKSPNSELMVTFNTDPEAAGYKTIEMMRWNGRLGRYEFQELNFGDKGEKPHIDTTGTKCMECHKSPDPRPNWDTYRAWAGVVPSRDDMMEKHSKKDDPDVYDTKSDMQPDARAYINFLDQIVDEKEKGKGRLALLDIPFDEKRQMAEYVKAAAGKKFSPREQVDLIKKKVNEDGFYRIKHFPDKEEAEGNSNITFNFDNKTAEWAGPSQFAFDQMLSQNMCKVATNLKQNKDFDKFKYALAMLMECGTKNLNNIYPDEYKKKILDYYAKTNYSQIGDIDQSKIPKKGEGLTFEKLSELINEDTQRSHGHANDFKFNRHGKFLNSYLTEIEKMPKDQAAEKANYYSELVVTPTLESFHAIGDEGGVKGVPEDSGPIISEARMLLEPFDVHVNHWSLVHGKNNAYNSFSFSDQFVLLKEQPLWEEIKQEAGGSCSDLEARAKAAFASEASKVEAVTPINNNVTDLSILCGQQGKGVNPALETSQLRDIGNLLMAQIKPEMKASMSKCLGCHDTDGDIEFTGLRKFVKEDDEAAFIDFLNSQNQGYNRPMIEVLQIKLGVLPRPEGEDFGRNMPPSKWKDNAEYAQKHGLSELEVQDVRRRELGTFLTLTAAKGSEERLKAFCEKINNDNYIKDFNSGSTQNHSSSAGKQ